MPSKKHRMYVCLNDTEEELAIFNECKDRIKAVQKRCDNRYKNINHYSKSINLNLSNRERVIMESILKYIIGLFTVSIVQVVLTLIILLYTIIRVTN